MKNWDTTEEIINAVNTTLVSSFTGAVDGINKKFRMNFSYCDIIPMVDNERVHSSEYIYNDKEVTFKYPIKKDSSLRFYGIEKTASPESRQSGRESLYN